MPAIRTGVQRLSVARILSRSVAPNLVRSPSPEDVRLRTPKDVHAGGTDATSQFEAQVFRLLLTYRQEFGLRAVHRFKNQLIDGALLLTNGAWVALEVKYRLGWGTACRSNWQIEWFLRRHAPDRSSYHYGLVIFGAFSGDWKTPRHGMPVGWDHWYRGHASFHGPGIQIGLAQFVNDELLPYPKSRRGE